MAAAAVASGPPRLEAPKAPRPEDCAKATDDCTKATEAARGRASHGPTTKDVPMKNETKNPTKFETKNQSKTRAWTKAFAPALAMIAAAGLTACAVEVEGDGEDAEPTDPSSVTLSETAAQLTDSEAAAAIPVASTEIARVKLFFGDLVYTAPAEQEPSDVAGTPAGNPSAINAIEISRPDSAGTLRGMVGDRSPLEEFLITTPSTVPVPRALLASEPAGPVRDRAMARAQVERLTAAVVGLPQAQLTTVTTTLGNTSYCTGTTSASFLANVCSLTNWDVNFCHNGTWFSVTDEVGSSNKKRNSRGYTLACGANGRQRQYYKAGGIWYKPVDEAIPSGQLWRITRNGNWALARAITHSRTAAGFVRASSHFNVSF
jgi:hypothetical protein